MIWERSTGFLLFIQLMLLIVDGTCCFPVDPDETANKERSDLREPRSVSKALPPPQCYLKYFLDNCPPQGLLSDHPTAERFICQSLPSSPDVDYFATLFDDEAGIALLSAYTVSYAQAQNMGLFPRKTVSNYWRTEKGLSRQGTNEMYNGRGTGPEGIDKGHLNPAHFNSFDKQHVLATFTYSNAVPQYGHFNRGLWSSYEDKLVDYVTSECAGKHGESAVMYVLTGASRFRLKVGAKRPTQDRDHFEVQYFPTADAKERIVLPQSMWTAGCCVWKDKSTGEERAQSIAVMGNNDFDREKIQMTSMNLSELETILVPIRRQPVDLFSSVAECRSNNYLL